MNHAVQGRDPPTAALSCGDKEMLDTRLRLRPRLNPSSPIASEFRTAKIPTNLIQRLRIGSTMAIYQFNIRDERGVILDDEGADLPDVTAALNEIIQSANEFFSEASAPTAMLMEVTDEQGRVLLSVPLQNLANARSSGATRMAMA